MFNGGGNPATLDMTARDVYPTAGGATTSGRASAATADSAYAGSASGAAASASRQAVAAVQSGGLLGQPLTWWGLILALLFGLMYLAQHLGEDDDFANMRMTTYNVIISGMSAIVFIVFAKMFFGRFKVPGLSPLVMSV